MKTIQTKTSKSTASKDIVEQLAASLASRDAALLNQMKYAAALSTVEQSALQVEQQRLAKKYGANSTQAAVAAQRLTLLGTESSSIATSIARASVELPKLEAGQFLVTGTILDANRKGLRSAKIAATDNSGAVLAKATSAAQGYFELRVPVRAGAQTKGAAAETTPISFQLVITEKSLQQPYTYPDTLVAVDGRLAYREIDIGAAASG
jgi:hypothetical protein